MSGSRTGAGPSRSRTGSGKWRATQTAPSATFTTATTSRAPSPGCSSYPVFLSDLDIESCCGCRSCFDRGEERCPRHDRLLELRERIRGSDGVILASPVHVNDVSGTMKTPIDRLAFVCHRPDFARTAFCLVATAAASPFGHTIRTLESAVPSWGGAIATRLGVAAGAFTPRAGIEAKDGKRIRRSARRYHRFLRDRRIERPAFVSLMMFRIQQIAWGKADAQTADGMYWRERDWLDPRRAFYAPHRAHPAKVALARLVGGMAGASAPCARRWRATSACSLSARTWTCSAPRRSRTLPRSSSPQSERAGPIDGSQPSGLPY